VAEKMTGTVKKFDAKKGWGFIKPDNGSEDVFVHHTNIDAEGFRTLDEGATVEFEAIPGKKGLQAVNVRQV
jgi:CspA family cold shock protein